MLFRSNTEQMRLQSGGQLTIGSTAAGAKLDVHQTTGTAVGRFTTYGNTNDIELRRTGGTQVSPTATSGSGTVLGRLFGQGYNGSGLHLQLVFHSKQTLQEEHQLTCQVQLYLIRLPMVVEH